MLKVEEFSGDIWVSYDDLPILGVTHKQGNLLYWPNSKRDLSWIKGLQITPMNAKRTAAHARYIVKIVEGFKCRQFRRPQGTR